MKPNGKRSSGSISITLAALTTHRIHSAGEAEEAFYANLKSVDLVA